MGKSEGRGRKEAMQRWFLPLLASVSIIAGSGALTGGIVSAYSSGAITVREIADFEKLMKDIEFDMNEMQATIVFEETGPALDYATRLLESFGLVENFFIARGSADAVGWSREYKGLATGIAAYIRAGQFDEAYRVSLEFSEACEVCHDVYRPL